MIAKLVILSLCLGVIYCINDDSPQCTTETSCHSCISSSPDCAWCKQHGFDSTGEPRCDYVGNLRDRDCRPEEIVNPESSLQTTRNNIYGRPKAQILPQEVHLTLRPNTPFDLDIQYRQAETEENSYTRILSTVVLNIKGSRKDVNIQFYSKCLGEHMQRTAYCKGLQYDSKVDFTARIKFTKCPERKQDREQVFQIYPVGVEQALTVRLTMICECDCEKPGFSEANSRICRGNGKYQCGICNCDWPNFGKSCECSGSRRIEHGINSCLQPGSSIDCSDRGECSCGQCQCDARENPDEVIYGEFCECDNFSCERSTGNGKMCSGNGKCECGRCRCDSDWQGAACDCSMRVYTCYRKRGEPLCSGNGRCACGQCQCEGRHSGQFCEDCPTCASKCEVFQPCVKCKVFDKGVQVYGKEQCQARCNFFKLDVVEEAKSANYKERMCHYDDDAVYKFAYGYDQQTMRYNVRVQVVNSTVPYILKATPEECSPKNDTCISKPGGPICSGNGECICGQCECYPYPGGTTERKYSGQFCEECPSCEDKCDLYKPCVQCRVFSTGEFTQEQCRDNCSYFKLGVIGEVKPESSSERLCVFLDDDHYKVTFVYGYEQEEHFVRAERRKSVAPTVQNLENVPDGASTVCYLPSTLSLIFLIMIVLKSQICSF